MKYGLLASVLAVVANAQTPGLTIYNQNFAVVRQSLKLDLKAGVTPVEFTGDYHVFGLVCRYCAIQRATQCCGILEQNYQSDPVSQDAMLAKFEGQTIDFLVNEQTVRAKSFAPATTRDESATGLNGYVWIAGALITEERQTCFRLPMNLK